MNIGCVCVCVCVYVTLKDTFYTTGPKFGIIKIC